MESFLLGLFPIRSIENLSEMETAFKGKKLLPQGTHSFFCGASSDRGGIYFSMGVIFLGGSALRL